MIFRGRRLASISLALLAAVSRPLRAQATTEELPWAHADSVIAVGASKVGLKAHAWRDFMPQPGHAAVGSNLMVNLQIQSPDGRELPTGLAVDSAWVRCAEGRWRTAPTHEPRPTLANGLDLMLRGGPRWSTGQVVDVLVRLRLPNGDLLYLEARERPIGRTE